MELIQRLVDSFTRGLEQSNDIPLWHGHRVAIVDGSGFSMPDTAELAAYFGRPGKQKPGCGFPVARAVALFDGRTGFVSDVIITPMRTHDMSRVAQLHPKLSAGDIVLGDRGFCSYAHLALISRAHLHAVFRVHSSQIVDFQPHRPWARTTAGLPRSRWIARLGPEDRLVEWCKPYPIPKWMTAEQYASLPQGTIVREIKWRIREHGCRVREVVLVTTLLDANRYPAAEIIRLYRLRWQVEVDLRDLKITLGMDVLKGHKVQTVIKEVLIYMLVHNLVRMVMVKAARRQRVRPRRISFTDALRWLQPSKPDAPLPDLVVNPLRRGRIEPRCVKRRTKKYALMICPRHELRKRLKKRLDAA